jgi:hypothetical protein
VLTRDVGCVGDDPTAVVARGDRRDAIPAATVVEISNTGMMVVEVDSMGSSGLTAICGLAAICRLGAHGSSPSAAWDTGDLGDVDA